MMRKRAGATAKLFVPFTEGGGMEIFMSDFSSGPIAKDARILKNLNTEYIDGKTLEYPFAIQNDEVEGRNIPTVGMIRVPLIDEDKLSERRDVTTKSGQVIRVRDIYLDGTPHMTYYRRLYTADGKAKTAEPVEGGHYGEWRTPAEIVEGMKNGRKLLPLARKLCRDTILLAEEEQRQKMLEEAKETEDMFVHATDAEDFSE